MARGTAQSGAARGSRTSEVETWVDTTATAAADQRTRTLTPTEIAWFAAIPAAIVTVILIAVVGPPLGRTLLPHGEVAYWPAIAWMFRPEAAEQGRFIVSLAGPLVLAALIVTGVARRPQLASQSVAPFVAAVQAAGIVFVAWCMVEQRAFVFGPVYWVDPTYSRRAYFTLATYAVAALLTVAVVGLTRNAQARHRLASWMHDTPARRVVAGSVAAAFVVIWLLHAYNTEGSIGLAQPAISYHMEFTFDETYAVLNGRSPLVDFASQYGSLWPYPFAAVMSVVGETVDAFLALALLVTGVAMLAMYGVMRRLARSWIAGLLLFLPFLATSFFLVRGTLENRYTFGTLNGTFPMRYAGPFLLAWLVVRHLDGARPRQPWLIFLAAGLVVLNNADAGIPALGATIAAFLWAGGRPSRASIGRLALAALAGLAAAFALVSILTLLRTGSLPHLDLLLRYSRMFGAAGFGMLPMPTLGLHTIIYLTFVAAIGTATVRAVSRAPDQALTGMLAFSGVFGLGAGAYYVGRSHPESLIATFTTWSFALALLTLVTLRALAARPSGRPQLAEIACVFGFAIAACSLAQTPLPWQQIDRLNTVSAPIFDRPLGRDFVAANTRPDERVLILTLLGHHIAEHVGVTNVSMYTGSQSMPLREQLDEALTALQREGGTKVFVNAGDTPGEALAALQSSGYLVARADQRTGMQMWVDGITR